MIGRPKKTDEVGEKIEPVEPIEVKFEPVVSGNKKPGLNVYRIEGFISDVKKLVENLPLGEIPVEFTFESTSVRIMGRAVFLLVTKKDSSSKLKCKVIDAMGIEKLNDALGSMELTNFVDMFIIPAQINKRTQVRQYLAILVGE
jgi:hypothetical protein